MNATDINSIEYARKAGVEIWNYYGTYKQLIKLMEELAELIIELSRTVNIDKRASFDKLTEEIADVEFMLMQLKTALDIDQAEVEKMIVYKAHRTMDKIGLIKNDEATDICGH